MQKRWTSMDAVVFTAGYLGRQGTRSPRLDAELLLGEVLGCDRIQIYLDHDRPLTTEELERYRGLIERRRAGEPVAYVLGRCEFYGWPLFVDRRVLVPRPETETLVEQANRVLERRGPAARALDVGTGSGAIAVALGRLQPTAYLDAVDVSPEAIEVARRNVHRHGLTLRMRLREGDLFAPVADEPAYDLIVANPPYIPSASIAGLMRDVTLFEPHLALDGGDDGLAIMRRIAALAPWHLLPGGSLLLEVGDGQSDTVRGIVRATGAFAEPESVRDLGGTERVVHAIRR